MKFSRANFLLCMASILWSQTSLAACLYVPEQQLQLTVQSCETIDPRVHPRLSGYIGNGQSSDWEARIERSYSGALITAADGTYFLSDDTLSACDSISRGARLDAKVGTACCDGDPNSPCILGTSKYIIEHVIIIQ